MIGICGSGGRENTVVVVVVGSFVRRLEQCRTASEQKWERQRETETERGGGDVVIGPNAGATSGGHNPAAGSRLFGRESASARGR